MDAETGKMLLSVSTESGAEEFFALLLHLQNRISFRQKFQNCKQITASGTEISGGKEQILLKSNTLYLRTHLLPSNAHIMYFKDSSANELLYDKILIWRIFPAEDSYELENTIASFQKQKKNHPFMEICLMLYNGNIQTGSTDLKSKSESLKESEHICKNKYKNCRVISMDSESQFFEKINYILFSSIQFQYKVYSESLVDKLKTIENDLQDAIEYFDIYCDFPLELLPPEKMEKICSWNQVKNSTNLLKTYFENFIGSYRDSAEYTKLEKYLIDFYKHQIEGICIWDLNKDISKLRDKLRSQYNHVKDQYAKNAVSAPKDEIDYSRQKYNDLRLKFKKITIDFLKEDSKKIICNHIIDKIKIYRSKLK